MRQKSSRLLPPDKCVVERPNNSTLPHRISHVIGGQCVGDLVQKEVDGAGEASAQVSPQLGGTVEAMMDVGLDGFVVDACVKPCEEGSTADAVGDTCDDDVAVESVREVLENGGGVEHLGDTTEEGGGANSLG